MVLFKNLNDDEIIEFKKWARDNYKRLSPIEGVWHPVIQKECSEMNLELSEKINFEIDEKD